MRIVFYHRDTFDAWFFPLHFYVRGDSVSNKDYFKKNGFFIIFNPKNGFFRGNEPF